METNNKYKMFRNFMINELQISKEDIQFWCKEAIEKEIKGLIAQEYGKFSIEKIIKDIVFENQGYFTGKNLSDSIRDKVSKEFFKNLEINIKMKDVRD